MLNCYDCGLCRWGFLELVAFYEDLNVGQKSQALGVFGVVLSVPLCSHVGRPEEAGGSGVPLQSESTRTSQGIFLVPSPVYPQQYPHCFKYDTMKNTLINRRRYNKKSQFLRSEGSNALHQISSSWSSKWDIIKKKYFEFKFACLFFL